MTIDFSSYSMICLAKDAISNMVLYYHSPKSYSEKKRQDIVGFSTANQETHTNSTAMLLGGI